MTEMRFGRVTRNQGLRGSVLGVSVPAFDRAATIDSWGFSMVEVTLAIAILAFCSVALIGLLPVGITTQQAATEQTKAAFALEAMATCIRGMHRDSQNICRVTLPSVEPLEFDFAPGGKPFSLSYGFTEVGTFCKAGDFARVRGLCGTIYAKFKPPATPDETGSVYLTAAWPGAAFHDEDRWRCDSGYVETVAYFNLPQED